MKDSANIAAGFEEHSTTVDGVSVRYYQAGQGDPLIVLHGAGGHRFSRALDLLAQDRLVVCIEMPGWGAGEYHCDTLEQLAQTVAATISALGIEHYDLLGTSLGGAVATHLALDYPERVRAWSCRRRQPFGWAPHCRHPARHPKTCCDASAFIPNDPRRFSFPIPK